MPRALIAETIDIVAVLAGRGAQRRLAELAMVAGLDPATDDYRVLPSEADGRVPEMADDSEESREVENSAAARRSEILSAACLTASDAR